MNCEEFNFYEFVNSNTVGALNNSCNVFSSSSSRTSDYFTGYDKIDVQLTNCNNDVCGAICQYDDTNGSNFVRNSLREGSVELDSSKYYRISYTSSYNLPLYTKLYQCNSYTPIENIKYKLNGIDSDDLYSDLSVMAPFLIFLVIFSFTFMVLRRVINSSSRGDSNI